MEPSNNVSRAVTKSSWRSWITKDMIESPLHQRQRTSIARNLSDMLSEVRGCEKKGTNNPASFWETWKSHWETEEFKAKSAQCSKDHLSEKGGEGSDHSRHTRGSRTHREHTQQLEDNINANNEFVDQKSENTYDAILSKITSASQPEDGASVPTVAFSQIYLDEVGGVKKMHIYGLGSQPHLYGHVGASYASTSRPPNLGFNARVNECVGQRMQTMKEEMNNEMRSKIREEIRQEMGEEMRHELREEMRQEVQQEMHEQVDQILQERM
ncbi:hypothetical protein R3W88_019391 [Solanum pinnatisectum]|uniref:Uncharacterized protein n=1 Tax=Solanum pinnatisectum TaxID=50273 RepID=A0AAV9KJI6_9SOLN|nr:hypothetical protein R3W88_019391 [Solanum pinnatisectum]